jgi:hypothetical protein
MAVVTISYGERLIRLAYAYVLYNLCLNVHIKFFFVCCFAVFDHESEFVVLNFGQLECFVKLLVAVKTSEDRFAIRVQNGQVESVPAWVFVLDLERQKVVFIGTRVFYFCFISYCSSSAC